MRAVVSRRGLMSIVSNLYNLEEVEFVVDGKNLMIRPLDKDIAKIVGTLCVPFRDEPLSTDDGACL